MKVKTLSIFVAILMVAAIFVGCNKSAPSSNAGTSSAPSAPVETKEMTLYYSNSTEWADPLIEEFEKQTGIKVSLVQDGTSSLFARIKAEESNPQADVVWGGVIDTYRANQNLLQQYTSANAAEMKADAKDPNGYYSGFDMGPMVMVYNTDLISKADAPTGWADLLDPKYKGRIACADPTSSSSSFACIMSIILAYGTDGKGYEFVEKLVDNLDGKIVGSSSGVYKGVADGEYLVGLTYEEAAIRYMQSGASIQVVYPREGTSSSPAGMGIIKNCKNPVSAKKFVDYLTSKEVQSQLGGIYRRSVRTDVKDPDTMEAWGNINFVKMDIDWTSSNVKDFNEKWTDFVTK